MGYKRPTVKLIFDDPEMDGLEVRARRYTIGRYVDFVAASGTPLNGSDAEKNRRTLAEILAEAIIGWNLEDDADQPVPATTEGILDQDFRFLVGLTEGMLAANKGVPDPLGERSSDGGRSLEASMPMEFRSESPAG